jgi:hypothetical protein
LKPKREKIMKTTIRAGLACAAVMLWSSAAFAGVGIPAVPIGLDHDPEGIRALGTTNASGSATFSRVAPGRYVIVIDGRDLIAALGRTAVSGGRRASCLTIAIVGGAAAASPPVCRDAANRGVRIGVTVPARTGILGPAAGTATVRVTISDQGAAGGMTSR